MKMTNKKPYQNPETTVERYSATLLAGSNVEVKPDEGPGITDNGNSGSAAEGRSFGADLWTNVGGEDE